MSTGIIIAILFAWPRAGVPRAVVRVAPSAALREQIRQMREVVECLKLEIAATRCDCGAAFADSDFADYVGVLSQIDTRIRALAKGR